MSTIEKALEKLNAQQPAPVAAQSTDVAPEVSATPSSIEAAVAVQTSDVTSNSAVTPNSPNVDAPVAPAAQSALTDVTPVSKNYIDVDLKRLDALGFATLSTDRRLIFEEFRQIKRKLINNAFGPLSSTLNHANLIMVSSSRPSEGKTFTAVNLALSIALEQDKTVLLVDADVLRPNVSRTLDIQLPVGLTDYLSDDRYNAGDIIFSTNVERLKVIAAGRPHHLSTELLASDKMAKLAQEFATRYPDRIVIVDAPPLLGVNETSILAAMCGQALIVCEEKRTNLNELEKAISMLPKDIAAGFVINKAHYSRDKGYGYGYGYYGE